MGTDYNGVLVNETAARLLGYGNNPINKSIYTGSDSDQQYHILGVIKDFNSASLRDEIKPIAFHLGEDRSAISIRINTNNLSKLIAEIKSKYNSRELMAGKPFTYTFMDDDFNKLYESDQRNGKIILSFSLFTIMIACLGLFGLVTYAAEQRTKEIGIRKVLGASISTVIKLLTVDFIKLIIIALVIAFPLAWWVMHMWLQGFVYRVNISWWIFLLAGLCTLTIAFLTIFYQAIKTSVINPVNSLRIE
jgi:putative ABC transport system permease protein